MQMKAGKREREGVIMSNEECISMYTSTFMFLIDSLESVGGLMNTQDYPAIIYSLSPPHCCILSVC